MLDVILLLPTINGKCNPFHEKYELIPMVLRERFKYQRETMRNWKEQLEKIRKWIDQEDNDEIADKILVANKNKSESELFLQKLLNSIETLIRTEIIRIPNTNKAYIPEKFKVFLSEKKNESLRDDKRRFFEHSLSALIFERAKEMAGSLELTSVRIVVEILINRALDDEEIEVRVSSNNESIRSKTIEFFQSKGKFKSDKVFDLTGKDNKAFSESKGKNEGTDGIRTIEDFDTIIGILFRVEIWQAGKKINEIPIVQRKVTIGRDDDEKIANLRLPTENYKISRTHAEISFADNGEIWVTALHKNPITISGKAIRSGEKSKVETGDEIRIYDFTLKLK